MFIPEHPCRNCGTCCGNTVPITDMEEKVITNYVKTLNPETIRNLLITQLIVKENRHRVKKKDQKYFTRCQFRDEVEKKCVIYPVRPGICRFFGVMADCGREEWACSFGNSQQLIPPQSFMSQERHPMPDFLGVILP